MSLLYH